MNYNLNGPFFNLETTSFGTGSENAATSETYEPTLYSMGSDNATLDIEKNVNHRSSFSSLVSSINSEHQLQKKSRLSVIIAGWLIPINLVLNVLLISDQLEKQLLVEDTMTKMVVFKFLLFAFIILTAASFVLRCLEKLLITSTVIIIIGGTFSGVVSIILTVNYVVESKELTDEDKSNRASFISMLGSLVSLSIATLILLDFIRTRNFKSKGSGLPITQKYMQLSVLAVYVWACVGAVIFMFMETKALYKGLYFSLATMSTVGFGDYFPTTIASKIIFTIWISISFVVMGIFLTTTRTILVELFILKCKKQLARIEKKRKKLESYSLRKRNKKKSQETIASERSTDTKAQHFSRVKDYVFQWYYNTILLTRQKPQRNPEWISRMSRAHVSDEEAREMILDQAHLAYIKASSHLNKRIGVSIFLCVSFM
ncbi:hypothetical protein BB560_006234 [Smittium megazygosporum]|uniref:Potassium channel domain-containing protein n=1 Tax=Smittium megazygosporum TaxID=133381 RepID=A0A2T9YCV6_9FUNG|nr:hypothetical protein BB560_006234 [Smittium megazygosporum]